MTSSKLNNRTQGAIGHVTRQGSIQIAVRLDPKTFADLKTQAIKDKISIAEKIRNYIEIGLDVDIDLDDTPDITTFEGVS
jgi:hypothetical protein